ncbi:DUF6048 family protein [Flavobacterium urumqiense]|uniref:Outer membrane protein beta-barrel domain-containing protein n=1 Tax=Flavobacterium urumqiense TaxID=935224 RepID=A0A1H5VLR8_9FLAO|nr:DUF6048 family protein [Flavobacterium urumqiense]SEF87808.1 hypothetical protein SAMN04488130_103257 [Flavobacterium urumqiense]
MKHTLKYFFSFCLVLSISLAKAQDTSPKGELMKQSTPKTDGVIPKNPESFKKVDLTVKEKDSIIIVPVKTDRYGVRVGVDLYKLTRALYDKDYKGIEFVGDYRLTKKYFLAAELGNENKTTDDTRLNSTTKGSYLKAGFDYNAYQNWLNMENIISVGMRYGFSTFSQQLNSYKIYNANPYFGEVPPIPSGQKFNGLTASWIEVVAGVKAKVFDNVFVGFSLQLKRLVSNKQPNNFENLYIPGFNRTYNGDFGVGFNYTVTYFVPIYKKKVKPVEVSKKSDKKK